MNYIKSMYLHLLEKGNRGIGNKDHVKCLQRHAACRVVSKGGERKRTKKIKMKRKILILILTFAMTTNILDSFAISLSLPPSVFLLLFGTGHLTDCIGLYCHSSAQLIRVDIGIDIDVDTVAKKEEREKIIDSVVLCFALLNFQLPPCDLPSSPSSVLPPLSETVAF